MAKVVLGALFNYEISRENRGFKKTFLSMIEILKDYLEVKKISDSYTFTVKYLMIIDNNSMLLIESMCEGEVEAHSYYLGHAKEMVSEMANLAMNSPDFSHLDKYKRMHLENDMGI